MLALAASCVGDLVVSSRLRHSDRQCVLPGDASWLYEVRYLEEEVLRIVAAAARFDADRFVLSEDTLGGRPPVPADQTPVSGRPNVQQTLWPPAIFTVTSHPCSRPPHARPGRWAVLIRSPS
jgi:hypothetical protein